MPELRPRCPRCTARLFVERDVDRRRADDEYWCLACGYRPSIVPTEITATLSEEPNRRPREPSHGNRRL